jgi:hypothetical protein
MTTKFLRLLAATSLLTLATPVRAAVPPAEHLLPADTLLLVTAPDFAAVRAAAKQSPGWRFWNDPAMKPFHDKFTARWNEQFIAPMERDLGVKPGDFADLPQGQLALAITQNGWNGSDDSQQPGLILLLDARDRSGLLKTNLDALRKKWTENGKTIRTETVRGIAFSVVTLSSNDLPTLAGLFPRRPPVQELGKEPKPEKPGELVVGQFESLLIAGNSIKAVEPVVAHLSGGAAPALNDNAVFAADKLSQFRNAPLYYAWFNTKTFLDVLAHIPQEPPNPEAPTLLPALSPTALLTASGLMGLQSVSLSYRESHDGSQLNLYFSAPEAARQGLLKIFAAVPKDANPPAFVPANAMKFSRWRIDGQKSWAEVLKIVEAISPGALASLNATIDAVNALARQKDPDFDLRKNLIANLGDDFISYQKAPAGNTPEDMDQAPALFLFGAANADQAALALKNVAALMYGQQDAPEPRDFLGRKIYTIPQPGRRGPGAAAPVSRSLYCAASGGYVALTTDVSTLEEYLRSNTGQARPLSDLAGLAEAAQHVGGAGSGLFGYENQRETVRVAFTSLKNVATADRTTAVFPRSVRDWMDFSLLPDYDQVAKYFYFSVYGGGATADGLAFKVFAPRPPQMN